MSESDILNKIQWFKAHPLSVSPDEITAYERVEAYVRLSIANLLDDYHEAWLAGHPDKLNLIKQTED